MHRHWTDDSDTVVIACYTDAPLLCGWMGGTPSARLHFMSLRAVTTAKRGVDGFCVLTCGDSTASFHSWRTLPSPTTPYLYCPPTTSTDGLFLLCYSAYGSCLCQRLSAATIFHRMPLLPCSLAVTFCCNLAQHNRPRSSRRTLNYDMLLHVWTAPVASSGSVVVCLLSPAIFTPHRCCGDHFPNATTIGPAA